MGKENKLSKLEKTVLSDIEQESFDNLYPEWRDVYLDGKKTLYQISNTGSVWSVRQEKIMKTSCNSDGYLNITLYANKRMYRISIHILVARAFVPNPNPATKIQVKHKDGNKLRNYYKNLEWVTHKENIAHACRTGLRDTFRGVNSPKNIYPEETIREICKLLESNLPQLKIAAQLGVNKGTVNAIKQGWQWQHIAKEYNIPKPVSRKPRPPGLRQAVMLLLQEGKTPSEIIRLLDLSDDQLNRTYINVIKHEFKSKVESSSTRENTTAFEKYDAT